MRDRSVQPGDLNFFEPSPMRDYEIVAMEDERDWGAVRGLAGIPVLSDWKVPLVRLTYAYDGAEHRHADLPWFSNRAIGMRHSAMSVLSELLIGQGEFLPLRAGGETLYAFHPRAVAALDRPGSVIQYLPECSIIYSIPKPKFDMSLLAGVDIFMLPENGTTYVGPRFVELVERAGLTGLKFFRI